MKRADRVLLIVAAAVDAGTPIDWQTAEAEVKAERERRILAELKVLATIVHVYRQLE